MPGGYRKLTAEDDAVYAADRFAVDWMPRQEPGVRPSTALPYELEARGSLSRDGKRFEIALEARDKAFGKAAAGAPFHVYTPGRFRGDVKLRTRAYAVAAGGKVTDSWDMAGFEDGVYHLCICGPNGFLREFAGNGSDPRVSVSCEYVRGGSGLTGNVELRVVSRADRTLAVRVKDHGYKSGDHTIVLEPGRGRAIELALGASHHWYDFTVTIEGAERFVRRFAGRVETGREGFSDPVMGRVLT
jgi:phospholipase C